MGVVNVVMGCVSKGGNSGTDGGRTATVAFLSVFTNGLSNRMKRRFLRVTLPLPCILKVVCHLSTNSHDIFPRIGSHCFHLWTQPKCCPNLK